MPICLTGTGTGLRPSTPAIAICHQIGKITKPRRVWFVKDMLKTRCGKIMRRVLAAISNEKDVGDVTPP